MGERVGLSCRQVGEGLAVQARPARLEAVHELAVAQPMLSRGSVDPDHPQATKISFLATPTHIRVRERGVYSFFRRAIQLALGLVEAFGPSEKSPSLRPP